MHAERYRMRLVRRKSVSWNEGEFFLWGGVPTCVVGYHVGTVPVGHSKDGSTQGFVDVSLYIPSQGPLSVLDTSIHQHQSTLIPSWL